MSEYEVTVVIEADSVVHADQIISYALWSGDVTGAKVPSIKEVTNA